MFIAALGGRDAACQRFCRITLEVEAGANGGIANWGGEQAWVQRDVNRAYRDHYDEIRPQLVRGGVSAHAVLAVAGEMARAADWDTGRNSRLSNDQIARATGYSRSTIQRARQALRLLGLATEVLRGRQRTRHERMAAWRVGDRGRGWSSVWALHPRKPVDKTRVIIAGQVKMAPHPRRGLFSSSFSRRELLKTPRTCVKRAAPRQHSGGRAQAVASARDYRGALLASKWLRDRRSPTWGRQHSVRTWGFALSSAATHGWTPDDLNDLIDDWARRNHKQANPHTPLAFLRWLLARADLAFPPHLLDQIERDRELAEARARQAAAATKLIEEQARRADGRLALAGDGHAAARRIADAAARRRRQWKLQLMYPSALAIAKTDVQLAQPLDKD